MALDDRYLYTNEDPARPAPSALDKQIGGDHYKRGIQPVEYIKVNNLDFFEGSVVKYITRWRRKNGVEDLKKAIHYLEMLIEFETTKATDDAYETYKGLTQK